MWKDDSAEIIDDGKGKGNKEGIDGVVRKPSRNK